MLLHYGIRLTFCPLALVHICLTVWNSQVATKSCLHTVILPIGKVGSYRIFYSDFSQENNFESLKVIKIRDQKKPCLP